MRSSSDPFDDVRKLLALKRHERPPPGYFDRLPGEIRHRICNERLPRLSWWEVLAEQHPWIQDVVRTLEARPLAASAVGAAVGALVLAAVFAAYQAAQPHFPPVASPHHPSPAPQPALFAGALHGNAGFAKPIEIPASTNPVAPSLPPLELFGGLRLNAQPASFPISP